MGLDMYLDKHVYIGADYEHRKVAGTIDITVHGNPVPVNFKKVSYIVERAGYWRKANQIHAWFVRNIQKGNDDCGTYYVDSGDMKSLLDTVSEVLGDPTKAAKLLPTQDGFFFGDTNYDEYYFQDLEETKRILTEALADENGEYYYHSSW